MKIRFCENNKGVSTVLRRLKDDYPELSVKRKDCLKKCDPCDNMPFAVVNGETVKADDGEELYTSIVALLAEP